MPSAVILSGVADNGNYPALLKVAAKVKTLRHFEKFEDDLLCAKQGDNAFVFVKKTFPSYKALRFRNHVMNLLLRTGYGRPFEYQELANSEFEPYVRSIWRNNPKILPSPTTQIAFLVTLQSSTSIGGSPMTFNFAPSINLSDQAKRALAGAPATLLTSRADWEDRIKTLGAIDTHAQYRSWIATPVQQEISLTRDALEQFRIYYDQETTDLDTRVEKMLSDPIWNDTKLRRKAKDMRTLEETAPREFASVLATRRDYLLATGETQSADQMLSLREAPLNHQFMLELLGVVDGRTFDISLPL